MPEYGAVGRMLRRIFPGSAFHVERTPDGVSTEVYRITRGEQTFYLRLPLDHPANFAAEAAVHTELRRRGVRIPEVVHYELSAEELGRSVLVTTEIPGGPMTSDVPATEALPGIYRAAGRDLALVNQIGVEGFGWIQNRHPGWPLRAEHREFGRWIADFDAATLRHLGFGRADVQRVRQIVTEEVRHAPPAGRGLLAHGDFYVSQVFHRDGRYTGMIDFGSIQGSNGWHDLATFRLSDPEQNMPEDAAVPHLEAGYAEVAGMPPDFHARVLGTAVTIMAERLVRQYLEEGESARRRASFRIFLHHLHRLLHERAGSVRPEAGPVHGFTDVDRQEDPASWVRVLDALTDEPFYANYQSRVRALLHPVAGHRYLEVGAGTGASAARLIEEYDVDVVTLDSARTMTEVQRARGLPHPVAADAHSIPFPDDSFGGVSADRTIQHIADPERCIEEMVRITRPGGWVVLADPDYSTQTLSIEDQMLAAAILAYRAAHIRNGRLAHLHAPMLARLGLENIAVETVTATARDLDVFDHVWGLRTWAAPAAAAGFTDRDYTTAFQQQIDDAVACGAFTYTVTFFITTAQVPG